MSSLLQTIVPHIRVPPIQQLQWPTAVDCARTLDYRALIAAAGGVFGLAVHQTLFIRGEWHLHSLQIVQAHIVSLAAFMFMFIAISTDDDTISSSTDSRTVAAAAGSAATFSAAYLSALFASISTYRMFFHRLRRFPGPVGARFSKLWHVWACRDSRNFQVLDALSKNYGDFVRTGPNELTITHPDVHKVIDGVNNVCLKTDWYDITHPNISLVTARDKKLHDSRKRTWEQGFTAKAMARYETRTLHEVRLLEEQIKQDSQSDKASPVTTLFGWFGFDVMGDVVFGRSFGMLQKREWHTVIQRLGEALGLLGPFSPTPWIVHLGFRLGAGWIPMVRKWEGMIEWCRVQIEKKGKGQIGDQDPDHEDEPGNQNIAEKIDVGTYLTEDARKNGYTKSDWYWLTGDANLAIVAGSDTVTSTLIGLFYRLASNPDVSSKLYSELTANNTPVDDDKALAKLPYLKGIINEALRLHPALLTGGYRKTPKEGIVIGDQYIPGETNIIAPRWCIFRREDCFEDAESFVPERWCEKPEMVKNRTCYVPFGTGRHTCIGKSVAMMELRLVTANLVHKYRIGFADETAKTRFPASVRDCFTARMGPLDLRFERREGVGSET